MTEFLTNARDGWIVVGAAVLFLMVVATMHDAWISEEENNKAKIVFASLLLMVAVYFAGFR